MLAAIGSVIVPLLQVCAVCWRAGAAGCWRWCQITLAAVPAACARPPGEVAAQAQRVAETQRIETERNQQAIMRLLDEMSNLAEGDPHHYQATVAGAAGSDRRFSQLRRSKELHQMVATDQPVRHQILMARAPDAGAGLASGARQRRTNRERISARPPESIGAITSSDQSNITDTPFFRYWLAHSVRIGNGAQGCDTIGAHRRRRTANSRGLIQETNQSGAWGGKLRGRINGIVRARNRVNIAEQTNILALSDTFDRAWWPGNGAVSAVVADG